MPNLFRERQQSVNEKSYDIYIDITSVNEWNFIYIDKIKMRVIQNYFWKIISDYWNYDFIILETCNSKEDCDNGGECNPGDDGNYCKCKNGTEGNKCETVTTCNGMDCGTSAECGYKAELQKGVCQCKDEELSFDPDKKICKGRKFFI